MNPRAQRNAAGKIARDQNNDTPLPPRDKADMRALLSYARKLFPQAQCELNFSTPLDLLVAVMLSAQATDVSVNKVTPALFQKYRTAADYAAAPEETLARDIQRIGLYKTKAKNIRLAARALVDLHGGEVPREREALEALPGVGRKTANVVLSVAFGIPAFAVDTHILRISHRLGFTREGESPLAVEQKLTALTPKAQWNRAHHELIFFGRYHCKAVKPECAACKLAGGMCTVSSRFLARGAAK